MSSLARILCAIDLEKASERAFDRALNLAIIGKAKLFILHATPGNVSFSWRAAERLQYLTELRERGEAAGVKVRVETVTPLASSSFMPTPENRTSSFWAPTGAAAGSDSGRGQSPNVFCAVQPGPSSSCRGMLGELACSTRNAHTVPPRGRGRVREFLVSREFRGATVGLAVPVSRPNSPVVNRQPRAESGCPSRCKKGTLM
jgi:hypothetical protein